MDFWAAIQRLETLAQQSGALARRSIGAAAALVGITRIQAGLSTMVNGLTPVIPVASLVAGSTITFSYKTLNGNALTVELG